MERNFQFAILGGLSAGKSDRVRKSVTEVKLLWRPNKTLPLSEPTTITRCSRGVVNFPKRLTNPNI